MGITYNPLDPDGINIDRVRDLEAEYKARHDQASRRPPFNAVDDPTPQPLEPTDPMLQLFEYEHLPPHLREISKYFYTVAHVMAQLLPRNPERTVCLRKLREAKDCAVTARLWKEVG